VKCFTGDKKLFRAAIVTLGVAAVVLVPGAILLCERQSEASGRDDRRALAEKGIGMTADA